MPNAIHQQSSANPLENAPRAVSFCQNRDAAAALLRLHGIPSLRKPEQHAARFSRRYLVRVRDYQVWQIRREEQEHVWLHPALPDQRERVLQEVDANSMDQESKWVKQLAVRSIYALGLTAGEVEIGVRTPTRAHVLRVRPQAQEPQVAEAEWFALPQPSPSGQPVVLGADPEFMLLDEEGRLVLASRFFPRHGLIGCDAARYREEPLPHHHPIAEIRPDPAEDPAVLLHCLYEALRAAQERVPAPSLRWLAGGMPFRGYPIGGHIHISGAPLHFRLLRTLDAYLALPLVLIEDEGCIQRRPRYGFLGDFRIKEHGGFEYRTLPSWLISPVVAGGVLALAKLVAESYDRLDGEIAAIPHVQSAYYRGDKQKLRPLVNRLLAEIKTLPLYARYKPMLDGYFACLLRDSPWPADQDFLANWGLR